ncbi:hypothetical protein [Actinoallomurus sp. NPDC050550]|uniref:hypothetical protein n=1 Tax=Actinoallomurus sp. NPDC050550 TaxID=3154937 RepID=UPI0033E3DD84
MTEGKAVAGRHWRDQSIRCAENEPDDHDTNSNEPRRETHEEFHERADAVVRRLFMVGSDLHAALDHIDETTTARPSAAKINAAIRKLDTAIKDMHRMIFDFEKAGGER